MVASRPYRVIVSPEAFSDLDKILDYVKEQSPANAVKAIDTLWDAMARLKDLPHRYRVIQGIRSADRQVRRMPVPPYLVYYRVAETERVVRILTVRHASRRQPKRFR
jgi:plasmid stabilization system protein ParE